MRPLSRKAKIDERPLAPWGSFPLAELIVLAGIVMLVIGLIGQNPTAIGVGVVLAGLGGLEVSVREHFAGYRSHTTLLAGTVFVLVVGGLFYLGGLILAICLAVGAVAFLAAFLALRRAFQRASGGLSFRAGGPAAARPSTASRVTAALLAVSSVCEQQPLSRCECAEPLVLVERAGGGGTCGRGSVPSGAGWSNSSAIVMLSVSQGHSLTTSKASISPRAIERFNSARASRTRLARSRAWMCCGAWMAEAVVGAGAIEAASTGNSSLQGSVNWESL